MKKRIQKGESRHHRKCRSNGGDSSQKNISVVSEIKHEAWHVLFSNKNPEEICEEINLLWMEREWKMFFDNNQFQIREANYVSSKEL